MKHNCALGLTASTGSQRTLRGGNLVVVTNRKLCLGRKADFWAVVDPLLVPCRIPRQSGRNIDKLHRTTLRWAHTWVRIHATLGTEPGSGHIRMTLLAGVLARNDDVGLWSWWWCSCCIECVSWIVLYCFIYSDKNKDKMYKTQINQWKNKLTPFFISPLLLIPRKRSLTNKFIRNLEPLKNKLRKQRKVQVSRIGGKTCVGTR